jgi:hypothetical protein
LHVQIPIAPRAYAEGYQANLDGLPRRAPNGTTNRAGWLQGYDAAQAVREEWEADARASDLGEASE